MKHKTKLSAVFASRHFLSHFLYTQARRCFKCYIVLSGCVWLGAIFSNTQTGAIFGDKDISKCSYLVIRISVSVHIIYF